MKVYTLKSCDTCRKALKWLDEQKIAHSNHDIRQDGLDTATIQMIVQSLGWEKAVNRKSTTWRALSDADKSGIDDEKAVELIELHPTLMKRPVFAAKSGTAAGFDDRSREFLLQHSSA